MTNLTYRHCRLLKGAWIVARTYHLVHLGIMWKPVPTGECFNLSYMFACIQGDCYTCNHKWHNYDGIHLNVVLFIIGQLQNFYQVSSSDWHLKGSNDNSYINNWTDWFFFLYAVNATNKNYHLLCWVITRKVLNILQHQGLHTFLSVENIFLCTLVFDLLVTLRLIWILGLHQPCSQTLSKKTTEWPGINCLCMCVKSWQIIHYCVIGWLGPCFFWGSRAIGNEPRVPPELFCAWAVLYSCFKCILHTENVDC